METLELTRDELAIIRSEYKKAPQFCADNIHEACIMKGYYHRGKTHYIGVNYWTADQIEKGERTVFGEYQIFLGKLYI